MTGPDTAEVAPDSDTAAPPTAPIGPPRATSDRTVGLVAAAVLLAHLVTNVVTPYGIHRDELLYVAMGERLQLWRMEFPPFIALAARGTRTLLGDSLVALRLGPAVAATALVLCTAGIARELGGRRTASALAAL